MWSMTPSFCRAREKGKSRVVVVVVVVVVSRDARWELMGRQLRDGFSIYLWKRGCKLCAWAMSLPGDYYCCCCGSEYMRGLIGRGQKRLFWEGDSVFVKERMIGGKRDDIKGMNWHGLDCMTQLKCSSDYFCCE